MNIRHWFHHLFSPHCEECRIEAEYKSRCKSCETLKFQLDEALKQNRDLINALINQKTMPIKQEDESLNLPDTPMQPVLTGRAWSVRRSALEAEDRERARVLREHNKVDANARALHVQSIDKLEQELGINTEEIEEPVNG